MKHCFVLILHLLLLAPLFAQEELRLVSSRYSTIIDQTGFSSIQPVYTHKGSTLSADSGIIYEDEIGRQFFEAFGNVVITQPSGTIIYSDRLHYDAAPQIATLTNNVRMVDNNSVLTTNHLVYKMREEIGNYTGGGRIISKGDTITSRNAYYFENTQDAYFRNKVIVRTPDVKIYTDTMRYNSGQRMTYFFGPTNIKGNSGENLYTEKGNYNTETGVANFSKNNLYTEGSRFLKGDSLHYERQSGVGKAYRNVVFIDTLDKFYAYGGYGLYDQEKESITMTDKPLIIMVVESDSSNNVAADSSAGDTVDSLRVTPDIPSLKEESTIVPEEPVAPPEKELQTTPEVTLPADSLSAELARDTKKVDSVYMTADTLYSRMIMLRDYEALDFKLDRSGGEIETYEDVDYGAEDDDYGFDEEMSARDSLASLQDSLQIAVDSISSDTLRSVNAQQSLLIDSIPPDPIPAKSETLRSNVPTELPTILAADSTKKATAVKEAARADIAPSLERDSVLRQQAIIPDETTTDSLFNQALSVAQTPHTVFKDTSHQAYLDTARTRIVKAYYNVRLFKSDLQAVADSVYYGMADSMFRFMGRPMIWAEGSQISSDTIYMQIQNQRLDNALLINNAFMVNAVLDTLKFNQLKGRKITAFFANNSIDRLYVDGNAENLTFATNDKTKRITEMFHDRGARIKIKMEGKRITDYVTIRKVDQRVYPFKQVTQENEVLPGFIWRPQDRPTSKEDMMSRKREIKKSEEPTENTPVENVAKDPFEVDEEIVLEEETLEEEEASDAETTTIEQNEETAY